MKKLLAILTAISISSSGVSGVISCSVKTEDKTTDISKIEIKLILLLQTREDKSKPWDAKELEKAIVDQKIEAKGGIGVEAGDPISPGQLTEFEQKIVFTGNGNNKNQFLYSGSLTIIYAYGENLPPAKIKISSKDVETSLNSLNEFLNGTTFNNKDLVNKTFRNKANIPGAPVEGLSFGDVKNLKIEQESSENSESRPTLKFTFEANVALKDEAIYEFENDFDNNFQNYQGQVFAPVIIEQKNIDNIVEELNNELSSTTFFSEEYFKRKIQNIVEQNSLKEGIEFDSYQIKEIAANNNYSSKDWLPNIEIKLRPNTTQGYELPDGEKFITFDAKTNFTSLMGINDATLVWSIFKQKDETMLIAPQFIQFGDKNKKIMKTQGEYLLDNESTSKWGKKDSDLNPEEGENSDPWESEKGSNSAFQEKTKLIKRIFEANESSADTESFVNKYLKYTTNFKYDESYDLFKNDKALFFSEKANDWQTDLEKKLNQTGSLQELQESTTVIDKNTLTKPEYYHMVLLSKESDNNYKTSSKAFRVRLDPIKIT